jgi:hypothetical protein
MLLRQRTNLLIPQNEQGERHVANQIAAEMKP